MNYTILGASGFIGSHLLNYLQSSSIDVFHPRRTDYQSLLNILKSRPLGHLIYCIGLTGDFRQHPYETVDSHVGLLRVILENCAFDSLTYLSSTRLYRGNDITQEDISLNILPSDPDNLYNISKIMGESLCLSSGRICRIVRLSNVYGTNLNPDNFISMVLNESVRDGRVIFKTAPETTKDYVSVMDVVSWLASIAINSKYKIYNLASGRNISNEDIANAFNKIGVKTQYVALSPTISFPTIDISRVTKEFKPPEYNLIEDLPNLYKSIKNILNKQ